MEQRISLVTLGVADVERSRRFYETLGWQASPASGEDVAFFQVGGIVLSLWDRRRLAADTGVEEAGGWSGVALAHNVRSRAEVNAVVAEARRAGATITREPGDTFWGGYAGGFVDPDGHPWEIAYNPGWPLAADGSVALPR